MTEAPPDSNKPAESQSQVHIGQVLAGRYELLEFVDSGGMSTVYRALDRNTKKMVAVKILLEELCQDAAFIAHFEAESIAISRMTHPNVAALLDVGVEGPLRYLVIEFVFGTSLKEMIRQTGALRGDMAGQIAIRILSALQHAHMNGIIHRDVKPQNILIDKQGVVKVLDFGIARLVEPQDSRRDTLGTSPATNASLGITNNKEVLEDMPLGSVQYFSPEQAQGKAADQKSDIYSVGVVLYEMLTGSLPFTGTSHLEVALKHIEDTPRSPIEINPAINPALSEIVVRAMQKSPDKRYTSAGEMLVAIRQTLRKPEGAIAAYIPDAPSARASKPNSINIQATRLRWSRRVLTTSFTVLLLLVIGLLVTNLVRGVVHTLANHIVMPAVTNYTWDIASRKLEDLGLVVHRRDRIVDIGNENLVIEQSYLPGELLTRGSEVTLVVSKGEYDIIMPDLSHKTFNEALQVIAEQSLSLSVQEKIVSQVALGQVVGQMPAAGTMVRYGAGVMLTISGGLMVVPDLRQMTEQAARDWLKSDGQLVLSEVVYQVVNDSLMAGKVIAQSPEVTSQVMLQSPISLTVGKLDQRIYMGEAVVTLNLPKDALIRGMLARSDGTEDLQYCAIHPIGPSTVSFLVRSATPGTQILRIYNESELIQNLTITLE